MSKTDSKGLRSSIGGEAQAGSETLVEQAIKYLKIAHEKVQAARLAKCAAEAELTRYRDEVKSDINIKLLELMKAVMSQLAAAGQRATAAEQRANKAEATVRRLEDELRTLTMRTRARLVRTA